MSDISNSYTEKIMELLFKMRVKYDLEVPKSEFWLELGGVGTWYCLELSEHIWDLHTGQQVSSLLSISWP